MASEAYHAAVSALEAKASRVSEASQDVRAKLRLREMHDAFDYKEPTPEEWLSMGSVQSVATFQTDRKSRIIESRHYVMLVADEHGLISYSHISPDGTYMDQMKEALPLRCPSSVFSARLFVSNGRLFAILVDHVTRVCQLCPVCPGLKVGVYFKIGDQDPDSAGQVITAINFGAKDMIWCDSMVYALDLHRVVCDVYAGSGTALPSQSDVVRGVVGRLQIPLCRVALACKVAVSSLGALVVAGDDVLIFVRKGDDDYCVCGVTHLSINHETVDRYNSLMNEMRNHTNAACTLKDVDEDAVRKITTEIEEMSSFPFLVAREYHHGDQSIVRRETGPIEFDAGGDDHSWVATTMSDTVFSAVLVSSRGLMVTLDVSSGKLVWRSDVVRGAFTNASVMMSGDITTVAYARKDAIVVELFNHITLGSHQDIIYEDATYLCVQPAFFRSDLLSVVVQPDIMFTLTQPIQPDEELVKKVERMSI